MLRAESAAWAVKALSLKFHRELFRSFYLSPDICLHRRISLSDCKKKLIMPSWTQRPYILTEVRAAVLAGSRSCYSGIRQKNLFTLSEIGSACTDLSWNHLCLSKTPYMGCKFCLRLKLMCLTAGCAGMGLSEQPRTVIMTRTYCCEFHEFY